MVDLTPVALAVSIIAGLPLCIFVVLLVAMLANQRTKANTYLQESQLLANPPPPLTQPVSLRVMSFNVQDMLLVASHRHERMKAIARMLHRENLDIVGVQESFTKEQYTLISELDKLGSRLRYHQYYPSGLVGSGCLILSAFPIVENYFFRYTQGGKWYKFWHGDWWAGKGVGVARVRLPGKNQYLDFFNTHAHAWYDQPIGGEYDALRADNLKELGQWSRHANVSSLPAIVVGDYNCANTEPVFDVFMKHADATRQMDEDSDLDQICTLNNELYKFEIVKTKVIDETCEVGTGSNGSLIEPLSDHVAYFTQLRITPTSGSSGLQASNSNDDDDNGDMA